MLVVLVAVITFIGTTVLVYNKLGGSSGIKYVMIGDDGGSSSLLSRLKTVVDKYYLGEYDEEPQQKSMSEEIKPFLHSCRHLIVESKDSSMLISIYIYRHAEVSEPDEEHQCNLLRPTERIMEHEAAYDLHESYRCHDDKHNRADILFDKHHFIQGSPDSSIDCL